MLGSEHITSFSNPFCHNSSWSFGDWWTHWYHSSLANSALLPGRALWRLNSCLVEGPVDSLIRVDLFYMRCWRVLGQLWKHILTPAKTLIIQRSFISNIFQSFSHYTHYKILMCYYLQDRCFFLSIFHNILSGLTWTCKHVNGLGIRLCACTNLQICKATR